VVQLKILSEENKDINVKIKDLNARTKQFKQQEYCCTGARFEQVTHNNTIQRLYH
jgi:hypothetical protein